MSHPYGLRHRLVLRTPSTRILHDRDNSGLPEIGQSGMRKSVFLMPEIHSNELLRVPTKFPEELEGLGEATPCFRRFIATETYH